MLRNSAFIASFTVSHKSTPFYRLIRIYVYSRNRSEKGRKNEHTFAFQLIFLDETEQRDLQLHAKSFLAQKTSFELLRDFYKLLRIRSSISNLFILF